MAFIRSSFTRLPKFKRYDYKPIYFDPEKDERQTKRELRLERGSFYKQRNRSRLAGAFTEKEFAFRGHRKQSGSQTGRVVLLALMMGLVFAYYLGYLSAFFALAFFAITLLLFVRNVSKI